MKTRLLFWIGSISMLTMAIAGLATASGEGAGRLRGEIAAQAAGATIYLPDIMNGYVVLPPGWHEVGEGSASGGGISNNDEDSMFPAMAIAYDGTPYIAWDDNSSGDTEIYIRRWDGSNWVEVGAGSASGGGISNDDNTSDVPSLSIAPDGTPYLAWRNYIIGGSDIYVRRWNGVSWEEVGAGSASGGGISDTGLAYFPSVVVAPGGAAYVAWSDASQNSEIYLRRWNGRAWEEVGPGSASGRGISNTPGYSEYPSMAIAPDGAPYVAWQDSTSDYVSDIFVRWWNGTGWMEVSAGSASGGGISNSGEAGHPSMTISPGGMPYTAWQDDCCSFRSEIYVRRWNGTSWEEVCSGSTSNGGVSDNQVYQSEYPSIAIAPGGTPYVAWSDYYHEKDFGPSEIYVRRFGLE
jgi:hypothetical protein